MAANAVPLSQAAIDSRAGHHIKKEKGVFADTLPRLSFEKEGRRMKRSEPQSPPAALSIIRLAIARVTRKLFLAFHALSFCVLKHLNLHGPEMPCD